MIYMLYITYIDYIYAIYAIYVLYYGVKQQQTNICYVYAIHTYPQEAFPPLGCRPLLRVRTIYPSSMSECSFLPTG